MKQECANYILPATDAKTKNMNAKFFIALKIRFDYNLL